jgi:hypothetical protein
MKRIAALKNNNGSKRYLKKLNILEPNKSLVTHNINQACHIPERYIKLLTDTVKKVIHNNRLVYIEYQKYTPDMHIPLEDNTGMEVNYD